MDDLWAFNLKSIQSLSQISSNVTTVSFVYRLFPLLSMMKTFSPRLWLPNVENLPYHRLNWYCIGFTICAIRYLRRWCLLSPLDCTVALQVIWVSRDQHKFSTPLVRILRDGVTSWSAYTLSKCMYAVFKHLSYIFPKSLTLQCSLVDFVQGQSWIGNAR